MIMEFRDRGELRAKLPPRLPSDGDKRYLYLLHLRPGRYNGSVKVGITCNPGGRMNSCDWCDDRITSIWMSLPMTGALAKERELIALGNKLTGRRSGSKEEDFLLRAEKLERFHKCVSLARVSTNRRLPNLATHQPQ